MLGAVVAARRHLEAVLAVIDRQEGARENVEGTGFAFASLFTKADLGIKS